VPSTDITVRVTSTAPINMQLLNDIDGDGVAETPINLSGANHLELYLINGDTGGTTIYKTTDSSPKVAIAAGTAGSVSFTPNGTADLNIRSNGQLNIYSGYWWVYTTANSKYAVPDGFEFAIKVKP